MFIMILSSIIQKEFQGFKIKDCVFFLLSFLEESRIVCRLLYVMFALNNCMSLKTIVGYVLNVFNYRPIREI